MSFAFAVALFALVPAQDAAPPAPPAGDAPPPLVELAPATPTTPTEPPAPVDPEPTPPPLTPQPDKVAGPPQGIAPVGVAAIQLGVGVGACCAGCCISVPFTIGLGLIPIVGGAASSLGSSLIVGTTIGVAETWAGDAFGQQRAALIWPVVASAGILLSSSALSIVARIVEPATLPNPTQVDPTDPASVAAALGTAGGGPLTTIAGYYGLAACLGAIALPAIVYAITAEDKKPGDTGGFPGIMEPGHPPTPTTTSASASGVERTVAMRY
jgi:hypothetical protein